MIVASLFANRAIPRVHKAVCNMRLPFRIQTTPDKDTRLDCPITKEFKVPFKPWSEYALTTVFTVMEVLTLCYLTQIMNMYA